MGMIYLGVALVIGGAVTMLVSYHSTGSSLVADAGKILAFLGFAVYVVGRIRHGKTRKADPHGEDTRRENRPS